MKLKFYLSIGLFLSITFAYNISIAQLPQNYANVKVDQLSDSQIKQLIQRANEMGYSELEVGKVVAAQGMKPEEIKLLIARVEKIRNEDASNKNVIEPEEQSDKKNQQTQSDGTLVSKGISDDPEKTKPSSRIFGSELFNNGAISFDPNIRIATPMNYIIGPDDELLLDITGDNEVNYKLKVSPEGTIRIDYVGRISVSGLTVEQAIDKIRAQMARTYPAIRLGRTQLALNLGSIRSIKVIITGEVNKPGTYTISSLSTVFNALYASGGPNDNGSFRKIKVIRNNTVISIVDIYDFLIYGLQTGNVRLQDQDVIYIPVYQKRVDITGEVKRSALFELLPSETLSDAIKFAGGFSDRAYTARIKLFQNTPTERKIIDLALNEYSSYYPKSGDKIFVEPILERFENKIEIAGAVFRPGSFELTKDLTLSQLIKQAEGLREDAFQTRGYIIRENADKTSSLLPFNVAEVLKDGSSSDIVLQRNDNVQISSIFDLKEEYRISIQGEVRNPSSFIYADNLGIKDVVQMAGGFKEGANPSRIEVSRRIFRTDLTQKDAPSSEIFSLSIDSTLHISENEFALKPFDVITVYSTEGYAFQKNVKIEGEVIFPGTYTIKNRSERISDLIKRAGGVTAVAYKNGASLSRSGYSGKLNDKNGIEGSVNVGVDIIGIELEYILKHPYSKRDLLLQEGDIVKIPKELQTVKVSGEVLSPRTVVFKSGKSFDYYINGAGGFTQNAKRRRSYVVFANGAVKATKTSLFFNNYPKIRPGSEIYVPKKQEREKMNTQAWIGLSTGIATLVAIIFSILK